MQRAVNVLRPSKSGNELSSDELLAWLNESLQAHYTKVEQLRSGSAYCVFLDVLFPAAVALDAVRYAPQRKEHFVHNFRVFQQGLVQLGIHKSIPIAPLVRGHFDGNLAFLRWFRSFHDANYNGRPYQAFAHRGGKKLGPFVAGDPEDDEQSVVKAFKRAIPMPEEQRARRFRVDIAGMSVEAIMQEIRVERRRMATMIARLNNLVNETRNIEVNNRLVRIAQNLLRHPWLHDGNANNNNAIASAVTTESVENISDNNNTSDENTIGPMDNDKENHSDNGNASSVEHVSENLS